jgi:hypothetical protein
VVVEEEEVNVPSKAAVHLVLTTETHVARVLQKGNGRLV